MTQPSNSKSENLQAISLPSVVFNNYRSHRKRLIPLFIALIFMIVALVIAWFGYQQVEADILRYGAAIFWTSGKLYFIGIMVCILLFVIFLVSSYAPPKILVKVFDDNISYIKGKKQINMNWDEIDHLFLSFQQKHFMFFPTHSDRKLLLQDHLGSKIKLDSSITPYDDLLKSVRLNLFNKSYKYTFDKFQAGETVSFGIISLKNQTGLSFGKINIKLENINSAIIDKGYLILISGSQKRPLKCPVEKIDKLDFLLGILHYKGIPIQSST